MKNNMINYYPSILNTDLFKLEFIKVCGLRMKTHVRGVVGSNPNCGVNFMHHSYRSIENMAR